MNDILKTYMERFRENRHTLRRYTAFVLALAMITTLFVNWQLHGVGISMTAQYQCGEVEHTHTEACYEKVLTCGYEEGALENAAEVAAAEASQPSAEEEIMPLELEPQIEFVPHEHTEDCYTEVQTLTCMEEEHVHGDDCFDPEDGSLICEKFEHTHDESCYTTSYELTCGLEDGELVEQVVEPTQSAELAAMAMAEPVALEPVVDTVQPIYHHHTDACYEEVLTCPLPEHHHTVACLSDTSADIETPEQWQAANAEAVMTGEWNEDLLSVAKTQLGYEQSEKNFEIDPADGVTLRYYSRYGDSYNNPYGKWDVMFLSYCLKYAGIPQSAIPQEASVLALRSAMSGMDWLLEEDGGAAQPGDIVIYNKYVTRTVAVDSSADGVEADLDDLFSVDAEPAGTMDDSFSAAAEPADTLDDAFSVSAEFENSAELAEYDASAPDIAPTPGTQDSMLTPETVDPQPEQPAEKPVYSADTTAPSVVSPVAEPQTTTVTDALPVETVGIVSEVDSNASTLTVISGNVDGKVAEVTLLDADVLAVVDVAAAQYASQMPAISASRPNRAPALAAGTAPLPTADTYDFTENITSAKLQYRGSAGEQWQDIQDNSDVDEYDQIQAVLEYTLPPRTLSSSLNTIVYPLPEALKNFTEDGIVYNSNKEAVGVGKVENGHVSITFYDAYVQKNADGSEISGSLAFDGEAKEMNIQHDTETIINFNKSHSSKIIIKKDYNKKGDLHTSKQTSDYDLEKGAVKYTVKVWSTYGTADHPIQLEDIMTDIKLDRTQSITVVKKDGSSARIDNLTYETDDKGFTGTLPALGADEYYELTYWGVLPSDLKGGNVTTNNKIHVESKNSDDAKIESDASVDFSFNTVKKQGVKNSDGTITWTITLNENHAEMNGWTLSDELNGNAYTGTVTITPSAGTSFTAALPYKFGSDPADTNTTASYTITYNTTDDHPYNTSQVKNKVTLKDDKDNEKGSSEYGVEVGSKDAYFKAGTGVTDNGDGTLTLNWEVELIIDKDYPAGGWKWCDYASYYSVCAQYFTPAQRTALYDELTRVLGHSDYTVTDGYNPKADDGTGNWGSIGIVGNQPLQKDTVLKFSFSTTAKCPSTKTDFKNHCSFNNTAFEGTNTYKPSGNAVVKKLDKLTNSEANSSHDYHDINGKPEWKIEVTLTEAFKAAESGLDHIVITDTLPAGVKISDIDIKTNNYWGKNGEEKNDSVWNLHTWINNDASGGVTGHGPDIPVTTTTVGDHQVVTLRIPLRLLQCLAVDEKINIYVTTDITDNPANWVSTQKNFTNEVNVTDSTNKDWGTASQTQEITYNSLHDAVQKSGRQVDVGEAADTVEYTVIVNPDGQTILGNPDIKLTLVDDLAYTYDPWHNNMLITLKPSSVAVYEYDKATNALGSPLTVSEYSYLYETIGYGSGSGTENRINRLTFTLPNAKPLAVVYRYLSNASHDITLNNTATLLAQDKKITSVTDSQSVKITSSSWNANAKEGVYAYKVDKDNNGLYLSGAKFSFYAWDSDKSDWSLVSAEIVTDEQGALVDTAGKNLSEIMNSQKVQLRNQAFKLVETQAPAGYIFDPDNSYYFYIPDSNVTTYPEKLPSDLSAYHVTSAGGYLYLPNEKEQTQDYELPSTGGTGTLPFTAVGGTMMLTALVYSFIHHKRRREGRADD